MNRELMLNAKCRNLADEFNELVLLRRQVQLAEIGFHVRCSLQMCRAVSAMSTSLPQNQLPTDEAEIML